MARRECHYGKNHEQRLLENDCWAGEEDWVEYRILCQCGLSTGPSNDEIQAEEDWMNINHGLELGAFYV